MIQKIISSNDKNLIWLDAIDPSKEELHTLAQQFSLSDLSIQNCLEPVHLPKYQKESNYFFLILRSFDDSSQMLVGTVQDYTRKLIIFAGANFIVTIHRKEQPFLTDIFNRYKSNSTPDQKQNRDQIITEIITQLITSFEHPLNKSESAIDRFEQQTLAQSSSVLALKEIYLIKRQATVIRRTLRSTMDVLDDSHIELKAHQAAWQQALYRVKRMHFFAEEIEHAAKNLTGLQISIASHHASEVMRVLTLFSVFFMPLTFIVGIYGMNFEFMPELKMHYGYPAVIVTMIAISGAIFFWFKKRGWFN